MYNYKGKKIAITGADGFLGSRLMHTLVSKGARVVSPTRGDVRDINTFYSILDHTVDYLFHFGAPSSQILFQENPEYCADVTINGFLNAWRASKEYGIKLVYPSTGSLSGEKINEYARTKQVLEDIHASQINSALGLRIFATYGPGEEHKGAYASVITLFIRDMLEGKSPVIYGDGEQMRDFIYIEDTVESILKMAQSETGVHTICSGESVSFNKIVQLINKELGTDILPTYVGEPSGYLEKTSGIPSPLCTPKVSIEEGIAKTVKRLKLITKLQYAQASPGIPEHA